MRFLFIMFCEGDECGRCEIANTHDLCIGRAQIERSALDSGWKKIAKPGRGTQFFCPSCKEKRPWERYRAS